MTDPNVAVGPSPDTAAGETDPTPSAVLNPDARVLWRSPQSVQIELGTRRVVLDRITPRQVAALLDDPHRDDGRAGDWGDGWDDGLADARADLGAGGFMVVAATRRRPYGPPRLAAELAAVRTRRGGDAVDVVQRRRRATVVVYGPGRIAVVVGSLLAAAGVGRVCVRGEGLAQLPQCAPGGIEPADEGRTFTVAAAAALHRAAPEVHAGPPDPDRPVDLVVVAAGAVVDPDLSATLHRAGHAHLHVWAGGDRGVIGPMVVPGLSSCLRCAEESRLDRDPAWTALAAQLSVPGRHPGASDLALSMTVSGVASAQALAFLDGEPVSSVDATLEINPPDWRLRRRTWRAHPRCDCRGTATLTHRGAVGG